MDMHQEMRHEILRYLEKNSRVNLQEWSFIHSPACEEKQ